MWRRAICGWLAFGLAVLTSAAIGPQKAVTIALLRDGNSSHFDRTAGLLKEELTALVSGEWDLSFLEGPEYTADWTPRRARDILVSALRNPHVDVIYVDGLLLAEAVLAAGDRLSKPIVSGFVQDPSTVGLPIGAHGCSTVSNFTFVVVPYSAKEDLEVFRAIVPFQRLTVLVDKYYLDHSREAAAQAEAFTRQTGVPVTLVPITGSAEDTLAAIPDEAQAIYLTPSVVMDEAESKKLIDGITARKLPSFSMAGMTDVQRGVLAGQRCDEERRIFRRLALNVYQILRGAVPESLPVRIDSPAHLVVNARTARDIGIALPYRMLMAADLLHVEESEQGQPIDLATAFERALAKNPAIAAGAEEVRAAREDRLVARSALLPRLNANVQYAEVDRDRAASSLGMQPQRTTLGGFSVTQVIFNDPAFTAFRAQSRLYRSRRFEQTVRELDVLEQTARAYINVLSRKALLKIELSNLRQIQTYLDLARDRERAGVAGPEEIFRWEGHLAAARSSMTEAYAQADVAQTLLNQALGSDMDTQWQPIEGDALTANNLFFDPAFSQAIQNDFQFEALKRFLLDKALDRAPELKALDIAIQAQALVLNQQHRRFVVPEVGISFSFDHTFDRHEAEGSVTPSLWHLPEGEDDTWMVTAVASWPLFEGGGHIAGLRKAQAEFQRLKELRRQAELAVAQRVYDALFSLSSSESAITHTRQAAELARRNVEVVQQKYARGKVPIVDLLDAQTDVFVQEQRAALAKYQYMFDVVKMQRAVAWFPEREKPEDRSRWISDLESSLQRSKEKHP